MTSCHRALNLMIYLKQLHFHNIEEDMRWGVLQDIVNRHRALLQIHLTVSHWAHSSPHSANRLFFPCELTHLRDSEIRLHTDKLTDVNVAVVPVNDPTMYRRFGLWNPKLALNPMWTINRVSSQGPVSNATCHISPSKPPRKLMCRVWRVYLDPITPSILGLIIVISWYKPLDRSSSGRGVFRVIKSFKVYI